MELRNRFTERARNVMRLAEEEARRARQQSVDTQHILLALVSEGSGVAVNVLQNLGLHAAKIVMELEGLTDWGDGTSPMGPLRRTASAENVIEHAVDEARNLDHDYVGTEHVLLGLLREQSAVAALVLANLGLTLEAARKETIRLLCHPGSTGEVSRSSGMAASHADREFFLGLYRCAVDFYKPGMERRTGVLLGNIAVWDYSQFRRDAMQELRRRTSPWVVGLFPSLALRRHLRRHAQTFASQWADTRRV